MPSIPGKYQHFKNEDIDDYFSAVGVPYLARKMMSMSSPLMEISLDGDKMTIKSTSMMRTIESTFTLGEEYDEKMPDTTLKSKTVIIGDDELLTESLIPDSEYKTKRHYKFTDEGVVVTLSHDKAARPAKRHYKRVN
ncbi:hypothetical protein JYU34_007678 [Plutella xylostella]|uniref:Uncharacterized protein n=1 Tax=Plutella xylostella TaxID=51655 RepID=A0ABQ7QR12_PLUXY|nr:fatty acid-binding protein [Plutella xylostella]KAG7307479.1 hypothetical protein JYU34_007678 [Plutella xylostella]